MSGEVARYVAGVATARARVIAAAEGLAGDSEGFRPAAGEWSVPEVVEHLVLAEQAGVGGLWQAANGIRSGRPVWSGTAIHRGLSIEEVIERTWRLTGSGPISVRTSERAPEGAVPRGGGPLAYWTARLDACQSVLERLAAGLGGLDLEQVIIPHVVSGPLDACQRLEFLRWHLDHHRQQIEDIRAVLGAAGAGGGPGPAESRRSPAMSSTPIHIERRGPIAVLSMRHGRANALDVELCRSLVDALDQVERDAAAAVVLTGSGSMFSAGVDLRRVLAGGAAYVRDLLPVLRAAFERLAFFERPVVAAVNGHAIAGGFVLLAAADQAVMVADRGRVGVTELRVGVPFPAVALELVRLRAGGVEAARLVYRATTVGPDEALARGLVDELADADGLLARATDLAAGLAASGPALVLAKRQLRQPLRDALAAGPDAREAEVDEQWQADATLAAMRRYAEAVL